jgi:hypothetical protein
MQSYLAPALRQNHLVGTIGRYSWAITFELAISRANNFPDDGAMNLAWWIASAIRIRTQAELFAPAISDHSWSTIAAMDHGACNVRLLEDVPMAKRLTVPTKIDLVDMQWVTANLSIFSTLLEQPKFRLAVALCVNNRLDTDRL